MERKHRPTWRYLTFALLAGLLAWSPAVSDEFKLTPSVAIKQEYQDNIYFVEAIKTHDFITTASPSLSLLNKTERLDLNLSARLDAVYYARETDLNRYDQFYNASARYMLTPKLGVSGKGSWQSDSRPDRDLETTGVVLSTARRDRATAGLSTDYAFTEKTTGFLSFDWNKEKWRTEKFSFWDYEWYSVSGGLIRDMSALSPGMKAQLNTGYDRTKYEGMEIESWMGSLGITKKFHEAWTFSIDGGARYSTSRFQVQTLQLVPIFPPFFYRVVIVPQDEKNSGWGWLAHASLAYTGEKTNLSLSLGRDLTAASGYMAVVERSSASLSASRRLTWEWSGTLNATYFRNRATAGEFSTREINVETVSLTPGIRYEFTKDVFVDAGYTWQWRKDRFVDTEAQRNIIWARFTVQHPLFQ